MNYFPFHIGDYAKDTAHLSILEDGAYRRLLDLYYCTEKPLVKDRSKLYRLIRAQSKAERAAVDTVLDEFFIDTADGFSHTRCDTEIAKAKEKSDKARRSIEARWKNERNTNVSTDVQTNVIRTYNEGNTPNNQEPKKEKNIPADAGAALWEFGVTVLTEQGVKEGSARSFIGSILRDYDEKHVESALRSAVGKANAKAYIVAVLKDQPKRGQQMSIV